MCGARVKVRKKVYLPLVVLVLHLLLVVFSVPALGKESEDRGPEASPFEADLEIVSVAFDPKIVSYPNARKSPYDPAVNPAYALVERALVNLNPDGPGNPLSNIIQRGDTVVLKPNLVGKSGFAREGCTRTPVIRPLVDFAVRAGASKVIIAEGSATPYPDSAIFGPGYSNITGLVESLQSVYPDTVITFKDLNQDNFTWVDLEENSAFHGRYTSEELYSVGVMRMDEDSYYFAPDRHGYNPRGYRPGLYAIAQTILEADVLINVPKMKVHWITGVTLSLKNLIGITVSSTDNTTHEENIKDVPHWNNSNPKPAYNEVLDRQDSFENDIVWRVMADLNQIVLYADRNGVLQPTKQRKYLSVVDGIIGMEGPTIYDPPGVPRPTGVIVAGLNPVAVDVVCSRIMGFNYTILNSLVNMERVSGHPIGKADPSSICVVGTSLNNAAFREAYVPHQDYYDSRIEPHKIRLQYFEAPRPILIETDPEKPVQGVETKVVVYPDNIDLVASGWLRFSIDGNFSIVKMIRHGETMIGSLGFLEGGTNMSYNLCLQDNFLNTYWSNNIAILAAEAIHLRVVGSLLRTEVVIGEKVVVSATVVDDYGNQIEGATVEVSVDDTVGLSLTSLTDKGGGNYEGTLDTEELGAAGVTHTIVLRSSKKGYGSGQTTLTLIVQPRPDWWIIYIAAAAAIVAVAAVIYILTRRGRI